MNIFDKIIRFLDHTEVSFVTLLAKVIPLLVPIIPAYVGYSHVTNTATGLGFDPWAGWVYGAVIEGLGYAAIYKAVQFWEHNRKYTTEKNQAPLAMAVIIYVVYLVVTLIVNVVLDYKAGVVVYKVVALGLISLLSVPAGLLMSISAIHTERTNERERANEQSRLDRAERKRNEQPNEQRTNARANEHRQRRTERTNAPLPMPTNEHRTNSKQPFGFPTNEQDNKQARLFEHIEQLQVNGQPVPGPSELSRQLQMSKSYISERMKQWRE
jgi:putative Mn2+ efflux pump MntP